MRKVILVRQRAISDDKQTCGNLILLGEKGGVEFKCVTLELPWKDNQRNISCIPEGEYEVELYDSPSHGPGTFHLKDVPGRTYILIHAGNYTRDTAGCVLVGNRFADLDKDGVTDVLNSRATLKSLKSLVGPFSIKIMWI